MNLNEAKRVKLNDNLDHTIRRIVDYFFEVKSLKRKKRSLLGKVKIHLEDGSEGLVKIYLDPKLSKQFGYDVYAYMDVEKGITDPDKLFISIDPNTNKDKKSLYNTLYHEFLHSTDPIFTSKYSEKLLSTYDPDVDEKYWGHKVEFRAMANEILNTLVNEFKERKETLKDKKQLKSLVESNHNILHHFASGEPLSNLSKSIFSSMFATPDAKNIIMTIVREYPKAAESLPTPTENLDYLEKYLMNIKKFGGRKWNRFLSMLYTTHQEIMDLLTQE
jgi:hypothetical protein